jgi:hypothetical protein
MASLAQVPRRWAGRGSMNEIPWNRHSRTRSRLDIYRTCLSLLLLPIVAFLLLSVNLNEVRSFIERGGKNCPLQIGVESEIQCRGGGLWLVRFGGLTAGSTLHSHRRLS